MKANNYLFTSSRLGFRSWRAEDLEEFSQLNADKAVMEHFPTTLSKKEVEELIKKLQLQYTKQGFTYYATEIKATGEFIGMIGLAYQEYPSPFTPAIDIGWRLKKSAWGKGYATEGAKCCLAYGFKELNLKQIIAVCPEVNQRSENVMQKIGMKKLGAFDHPKLADHSRLKKHLCYQITKGASTL